MAQLAARARTQGWDIVQLDPAFRASRYFNYGGRRYAVHPDAFGILRRGAQLRPFFLEWERRAIRPATMYECVAPYLRYYSSRRPIDDHGVQPTLVVVLEDNIAGSHFRRLAEERMRMWGCSHTSWDILHLFERRCLCRRINHGRRYTSRPSVKRSISNVCH